MSILQERESVVNFEIFKPGKRKSVKGDKIKKIGGKKWLIFAKWLISLLAKFFANISYTDFFYQ